MGVTTDKKNKPLSPRGNDQSPKGYNRASLFSGKALDFDGVNDVVTTTYTSGFTGAQEFTYCAYVNADDIASAQAVVHANEATGWGLQSLWVASNTFRFYAGTGVEPTSFVNSETIEANKWYFVVGVHTPTENKIYLNGVLNATAAAANLTTAPQAITIGRFPSVTLPFNGETANVKVFNTALTAAQVADLYNNPEKVVPTGVDNTALKLWLPMQEGAGTTAINGAPDALGSELVTNGTFDTSDDWSHSAQWSIGSGKASYNGSGSGKLYQTGKNLVGTKNYILTFDVSNASTYANIWIGNQAGLNSYTASSTYQKYYNGTNAVLLEGANIGTETTLTFYANNTGSSFDIDNISLKEVANCGTISGATWTHGIGAPVAQTSVINWNKWKLEGGNTTNEYLIPQGLTAGRDLLGNLFENVRKQGALNLDGNSWAEVHDNASLDLTTAVTLEAWVYWTGSNSSKGILGRWFSGVASYMFYASTSTQLLFFINTSNSPVNISGTGWKHIVGTYDSTNRRVYVDGQEIGSGTGYTAAIAVGDKPIEIGRYAGNTSYEYDGDIAQPRIYNRALTAAEVQKNYNAGKNTYTN